MCVSIFEIMKAILNRPGGFVFKGRIKRRYSRETEVSDERVQIQNEIDKQLLNFRYYTYILVSLVSIIFTDNMR